jgi:hypothetical protein
LTFNRKILAIFLFIAVLTMPFSASADFLWTGKTPQLSLADGQAFIYDSTITLTAYANVGYKIEVSDGAKKATGYISTAMSSTTYGSELITASDDRTFASDTGFWAKNANVTIADGVCHYTAATQYEGISKTTAITITNRKLYTGLATISSFSAGNLAIICGDAVSQTQSGDGAKTFYCTASDAGNIFRFNARGATNTFDIDDVSLKEVTAINGGVQIVSTSGGATRNWESIESGFNYNAASYTIRIIPSGVMGSPF